MASELSRSGVVRCDRQQNASLCAHGMGMQCLPVRTLLSLVGTKNLSVAKHKVELLSEERAIRGERSCIFVRSRNTGTGTAHLIGQESDVAEVHINWGTRITVGPVVVGL